MAIDRAGPLKAKVLEIRAPATAWGPGVPNAANLFLLLTPQEADQVQETGCLTWKTPYDLVAEGVFELPRLLTGGFTQMRDIFFHHFRANPKSEEVIANQDRWCLDIVAEFQKPRAGVFEHMIQIMVNTNARRQETLSKLRLLRIFEGAPPDVSPSFVPLKIKPALLDAALFAQRTPVTYTDDCPPALRERVFMRGMFGPNWTPIESLYGDLFATRPTRFAAQKESLLFASVAGADQPLRMKIPEAARG